MADENVFESIETEEVKSLYFDSTLLQPDYELYRLSSVNGRVYFRFLNHVEQKDPVFYGGATNINREMPQDESLIRWISNKGYDESRRYYFMRSLFGSFSHTQLCNFIISGKCPLDLLPDFLRAYFFENEFYIHDKEFSDMSIEIKKDMISMKRWMEDCDVQFVFAEFPVYSDTDQLATPIDIGAFVTIREGSFGFKKDGVTLKKTKDYIDKRVFALINYKSGKGNFTTAHRFQLESEKNMFLERFPDFTTKDIKCFNLAAKDFRSFTWNDKSKPYSFSECPDIDVDRYNAYMLLAKNTREKRLAKPVSVITGEMGINDSATSFIQQRTIEEIVISGEWKNYQKSGQILQTIK